jgi:signal transduction histidine kinase
LATKIRNKILLLIILAIFLPFLIIGFIISRQTLHVLEHRFIIEQLEVLSSISSNVVDRHRSDMEELLIHFSQDDELPEIFDDPGVRSRITDEWAFTQVLFPERAWIYYGDVKNHIVVSPEWIADKDYDIKTRPWYVEAVNNTGIIWPEPFADYVTDEYVLTASVAIYDNKGQVCGVLAIDTFIDRFLDLLEYQAGNYDLPIFISTINGSIVGNNGASFLPELIVGSENWEQLIENMDSGYLTLDTNQKYLVTFVKLPYLNLVLGSLLPAERITSEVIPVLKSTVITFAIGLVAAIAVALLFSSYFVGNIENLFAYTRSIGDGSTDLKVCVSGKDELFHLNNCINKMVENLEHKTEMINSLFYLMSHTISNNITVINQKSSIMIEKYHTDNGKTGLAEMKSVKDLSGSIQKLLTNLIISKNIMEKGEGILFRKVISGTDVLSTVLNRQEERAAEKHQTINVKLSQTEIWINTDESLLIEILENLVNNAIKFSPPGGDIEISLTEAGDYASFIISDKGPGFSIEDEKKIFNRFARLSAQATAGENSKRIGLSVSKEIIEVLGGDILILSKEGFGAVLEVRIPKNFPKTGLDSAQTP